LGLTAGGARAQDRPTSDAVAELVHELERAWAGGTGSHGKPVEAAEPASSAPDPAPRKAPQTFYRYVKPDGRIEYTNIEEQVPVEQRFAARIDLSRVSLNTELGNELDRRFQREHQELAQSPYCREARERAEAGFLTQLFDEYGPLVVCGGLLLAFLVFTPSALRKYGGPVWAKTLMMAIPALAVVGVMTFSMTKTAKTVSRLKQLATPCSEQTFAALSRYENPVLKHAQLLELLKQQIDSASRVE
jgi:hypothetical protein